MNLKLVLKVVLYCVHRFNKQKCNRGYCNSGTNGRDVARFVTDCQWKCSVSAVFPIYFLRVHKHETHCFIYRILCE